MLCRLSIKNVALIDSADITFDGRLNVLSGETGAGKSVILDSINFVLGSKADKSMIRYGENEAVVRAEFSVDPAGPVAKAVEELDIECDGQIIITRRYSLDGKGSIKLNGNAVTAGMLKGITSKLVDVHGQSEHFYLLSETNQLKVIDGLCSEARPERDKLAELIASKKRTADRIARLGGDDRQRAAQMDFIDYQIKEIESAAVVPGEYDELIAKRNIINNTEKILTSLGSAASLLNSDGGCVDLISSARRAVASVSALSPEYEKIYSRLENLYTEADDIASSITDLADELSFNEREAEIISERIDLLRGIMKKYGADEQSVLDFLHEAKQKYEELAGSAELIESLNAELEKTDDEIYRLCVKISEKRKKCAVKFEKAVVEQLKSLNIPEARFVVEFARFDRQTANLNSLNGSDEVKFMFSANKGEPLKPLNKVISGGEMSRFMLAIKTQLKGINGISTYIFDEIDAGISGMTARTVAQKFIDISRDTQIIAVSHLPQVCAASHAQFLIYKTEESGKTVTRVKMLNDEEKLDELVRLTGSVSSAAALEHAKQLIAQFDK